MSPSAYRYQPMTDRNCVLSEKITALVQRYRRYRAGMIYLKGIASRLTKRDFDTSKRMSRYRYLVNRPSLMFTIFDKLQIRSTRQLYFLGATEVHASNNSPALRGLAALASLIKSLQL